MGVSGAVEKMEIGGDRGLKTSWGWVVKSLITCRLRLQRCNGCAQITWQVLSLAPVSMCVLVLLLLLFKGIVCLEMNVNIYSHSHCSVWFFLRSIKKNTLTFFFFFHFPDTVYFKSLNTSVWGTDQNKLFTENDICTICWSHSGCLFLI